MRLAPAGWCDVPLLAEPAAVRLRPEGRRGELLPASGVDERHRGGQQQRGRHHPLSICITDAQPQTVRGAPAPPRRAGEKTQDAAFPVSAVSRDPFANGVVHIY
eukprot:COSAG06_NODE_3014_length_5960_cov_2.963146_2_plen_104_part_00